MFLFHLKYSCDLENERQNDKVLMNLLSMGFSSNEWFCKYIHDIFCFRNISHVVCVITPASNRTYDSIEVVGT